MRKLLGISLMLWFVLATQTIAEGQIANGKIAFIVQHTYEQSSSDIYFINSDGSDLHRLTDDHYHDMGLDWSPDGKLLAFASDREDEKFSIYTVDEAGKEFINLTPDLPDLFDPKWSPDGRKMIVEGNGNIYAMDLKTKELVNLTKDEGIVNFALDWLADSEHTLFMSDRNYAPVPATDPRAFDLFVADIEGAEVKKLDVDMRGIYGEISPDRKALLMSGSARSGPDDLDLTYTLIFPVSTHTDGDIEFGQQTMETHGHYSRWSPDGQQIVTVLQNNIAVLDKDGTNVRVLTEGLFDEDARLLYPAWQPIIQ